ncbi:hypothetical protein MNBD_GAMMA07-989 [hydrothermal vent metagenome]|uniref:Uncharacterized protein n=1 Tax=hydrothermal vent metagenome TaxID=652676 RepID=A0A3B0X468_9ZZZZ
MVINARLKCYVIKASVGILISLFWLISYAAPKAVISFDVVPPKVVQDDFGSRLIWGVDHEIIVTVTDNVAVERVMLYYRNIGASIYIPKLMLNPILKDDYTVTIRASEIPSTGIEYYIQAKDVSGNILLHGLDFVPLRVTVKKRKVASNH